MNEKEFTSDEFTVHRQYIGDDWLINAVNGLFLGETLPIKHIQSLSLLISMQKSSVGFLCLTRKPKVI